MSAPKIFLIGPGFIGGEILRLLVDEGRYEITTMVRRQDAASSLEKLGVKSILATLDDKDIITKQTSQSDIVFHTATADHLPSAQAVVEGLRERAKDGKKTIYIHTSGTSLLADESAGEYKSEKIFTDAKADDIDSLPDSAPHRSIDLAIVNAIKPLGKAAKIAIMIPPLIYGLSKEGRTSIQLPTMTRYSMKHGYAGRVGKGLSIWSQVHVSDLARAYVTLLHWLEGDSSDSVYENPYFFCENGHELSWDDCAQVIGQELHKAGKVKSAETKSIPKELYGDIFGPDFTEVVIGSNSRSRANRLRALGWQPREKETLESLREDELPVLMKETGPFSGYAGAVAS